MPGVEVNDTLGNFLGRVREGETKAVALQRLVAPSAVLLDRDGIALLDYEVVTTEKAPYTLKPQQQGGQQNQDIDGLWSMYAPQQQHLHDTVLGDLVYLHGSRNGVDPKQFRHRVVANTILETLPLSVDNFQADQSITRILLVGPPASGKTSIMGNIYSKLKDRYSTFAPVYFVRAGELKLRRQEVTVAISHVRNCVVLLDDAQEWYDYSDFFALFKATGRLLVAAATYSVEQVNPKTPVEFQRRLRSNLVEEEIAPLLESLNVEPAHHSEMVNWFGDVYGRYHILVPPLLSRWSSLKRANPGVTLAETFFHAATMEDQAGARFLPELSDKMRKLLLKVWTGSATRGECERLVPYGVFDASGENWSCEYIRRKYFCDIFHPANPDASLFDANEGLPIELDLAKKGLEELHWNQLQMCAGSSTTGFPIEDVWQAEFYAAIGKYVPRELIFCKECVVQSGTKSGSVDFVLRNGSTRAIEFLLKSDDVIGHHRRFEEGAYNSLYLSGSYLVVDIKPWDNMPDLLNVANSQILQVANQCFARLGTEHRRMHHAVFLVSNNLSSGILYTYDTTTRGAVEYGRSPRV